MAGDDLAVTNRGETLSRVAVTSTNRPIIRGSTE
jgi:hypothetical protein